MVKQTDVVDIREELLNPRFGVEYAFIWGQTQDINSESQLGKGADFNKLGQSM